MPGRIGLFAAPETLADRFDATVGFDYEPRYNITPRAPLAAIRNDEPAVIDTVEWGLIAPWNRTKRLKFARSETVAEKPTFAEAFAERRCLVIADGYYEWQDQPGGPNQPHWIFRADEEPFAIAGIWDPADGYDRPTAAILTTPPSAAIEPIHDRMAAILRPEDEATWLAGDDPDRLQGLLGPFPPDQIHAHPVSRAVNDRSGEGPALIEPVDTGDQTGLDEFG